MNEKQITDRVEGGRVEPGITDRPADHNGSAFAAPPVAVARPRKMRWWMPISIVLLMGALIAYIQFSGLLPADGSIRRFAFPGDAAIQWFATQAACVLTVVLLAAWYLLFTGLWWRTRLMLIGLSFMLVVGFLVAVKMDGASGNMNFRWRFRWLPPADAALPKLPEGDVKTARDTTIHPGDFPQYLGPNRDAVVHGVSLDHDWAAHPPRQVWRQPIGAGWSAFAVAGDLAVTQEQRGADELIVARDRATGEPVWSHGNKVRFSEVMGGDGPRATPTIAAGKVYALGATGILDCLEAATGKPLWSQDTLKDSGEGNIEWGKSCSPLVIDDLGLVVVSLGGGGDGGSLAAYDIAKGERKWTAGKDKSSYASPMLATLAGRRQIVMVNAATVTGHNPADGKILWEFAWQTAPAKASQPPVLPDDRLLLTAGYGVPGVMLHVKRDGETWTTEEDWSTQRMRTKFTTPVVRDHYAYGLDDGVLACIDLDDEGKLMWQARSEGFGHGQVLLVNDVLIVQGEKGDVALVEANPSGYHKLGILPALSSKTWNNPVLAGNHLFLRNDQEAACYVVPTEEALDIQW